MAAAAAPGKRGWFRKLNRDNPWPWKFRLFSSSWRWKRVNLRFSLLDSILFHILYFLEAILLVGACCCFFLCCGCHV